MSRGTVEIGEVLRLPAPRLRGPSSLEATIAARRSVREFTPEPLGDEQLSQLLWAAQGRTTDDGLRASPSAGALYPLELYVATSGGLYHYGTEHHVLTVVRAGDVRPALCRASLNQASVGHAPAVFVITAVIARTAKEYGRERSPRYVDMEVGHVAQNLLLQAAALGLGGVPIGAFHDDRVQSVLGLPSHEEPRYLIPVGNPR